MKEVIKLIARSKDDPLRFMAPYCHELVTFPIDEEHPLYERFNDTRTVYEQYCSGEQYLKYDNDRLYSRAAHEYMISEAGRYKDI